MAPAVREQIHRALAALPYPLSLHYHLWLHRRRMSDATRLAIASDMALWRKLGAPSEVQAGPFSGMRYPPLSHGSVLLPKILGCYEHELHGSIEDLCRRSVDRVVDIGAAEGYYAVGFARRLRVSVAAFELHQRGRAFTDHLGRTNGVRALIDLRGRCEPQGLADSLRSARRPAVMSDCEGAEMDLLDPDRVPALRHAVILVELHDQARPGVTAAIRDRFVGTHTITSIAPQEALGSGEILERARAAVTPDEWKRLREERRGQPTTWNYLVPHSHA